MTIRIVIAEDQPLVRRGMVLLLSLEPDMEVVGEAPDGVEALELSRRFKPDVVLMDLHMPRMGGVAATREITRELPGTQVLVLTTLNDDETVFEAVRAGALGYLLKDATEPELLETIRALRRGESVLTPQIARKVMDQFRRLAERAENAAAAAPAAATAPAASTAATAPAAPTPTPTPTATAAAVPPAAAGPLSLRAASGLETLSDKEEKILRLICEGMSNRQIANAVFLAEGTIKNYVSRIMEKLHASTRTELAVLSDRQRRNR